MKLNHNYVGTPYIYGIIIIYHLLLMAFILYSNKPFAGSGSYGSIAEHWLNQGIYSRDGVNPTFYRPPMYPFLLLISKFVGGESWDLFARVFQCLFGIGCALFIFKITLKISPNPWAAIVAVGLYLLHCLLQLEHFAQRETILFEFFVLVYAYIFVSGKRKGLKKILLLAFVAAVLYLTRPTGILFFIVGLLLIPWFEKDFRGKAKTAATFFVFFVILISPWQFYQYANFSKISLSSSNTSGINLYKGNSPAIQSIYPQIDVDHSEEYIVKDLQRHGINPQDEYFVNSFLTARSVQFIKRDPNLFLKNLAVKFIAFFSPLVVPLGKGSLEFYDDKIVIENYILSIDWLRINHFFISVIIIPFGFFECVRWKNKNDSEQRFKFFSLLIFFLFTCVHLLTFAETRFRLPLDGFLCVLAGIFISSKMSFYYIQSKTQKA